MARRTTLYAHKPPPHEVQNANAVHAAQRQARAGVSHYRRATNWLAVQATRLVGSMECAALFSVIAITGFPPPGATTQQYVQWVAQTFFQLVLLSVILVGSNVLAEKASIQSDEQFKLVQNTEHHEEQNILHMEAQDRQLLLMTRLIVLALGLLIGTQLAQLLLLKPRKPR